MQKAGPKRPLPARVETICRKVAAPPRLVAHLTLVHDVAAGLVEGVERHFPRLDFDRESVLFGAATHDVGKSPHRAELTGEGDRHEAAGERLLLDLGVEPRLARFARTHAAWKSGEALPLEDLLVALADNCWKGKRVAVLEDAAAELVARQTGAEVWQVFLQLDHLLQSLAEDADERLAWQGRFAA